MKHYSTPACLGTSGNMTAYSEAARGPEKGLNNGKDMQWGGGSLFVSNSEKADSKTGKAALSSLCTSSVKAFFVRRKHYSDGQVVSLFQANQH